jgi:hypothetical protein
VKLNIGKKERAPGEKREGEIWERKKREKEG